jgi:hypothetical protein
MKTSVTSQEVNTTQLQQALQLGIDRASSQLPQLDLLTGEARPSNQDAASWAIKQLAQVMLLDKAAGQSVQQIEVGALGESGPSSDIKEAHQTNEATEALRSCLALGAAGAPLVKDFMTLATEQSRTIAPALLPACLNFVFEHPEDCLTPFRWQMAFGARGLWLAKQNPEWNSLELTNLELVSLDEKILLSQWQIALIDERLKMLALLCEKKPQAIQTLIEATRATDSPVETAQYINACERIILAFEPNWLEAMLDAKQKTVRTAAANNLKHHRNSGLVERAMSYLMGRVDQKPLFEISQARSLMGLLKAKPTLEIHLPSVDKLPEKALLRDGYELKAVTTTEQSIGAKMSLVLQWLAIVPLTLLCKQLGIEPLSFLEAVSKHDAAHALLQAICQSALLDQEVEPVIADQLIRNTALNSHQLLPLVNRLSLAERRNYFLQQPKHLTIESVCQVFKSNEQVGIDLSIAIISYFDQHKATPYTLWSSIKTAHLALLLDSSIAMPFCTKAQQLRAQNTADMAAEKKAYAASFWELLFHTIELKANYTKALTQ